MVATNYAKQQLALQMARSGTIPLYLALGSGSGTALVTNGSLVTPVGSRIFYDVRDTGTPQEVRFEFSRSPLILSGLPLLEFGVGAGSVVGEVDLWNREAFENAIEFDGTLELQVEVTFETF